MGNITLENNQSICIQKQNLITGTNFVNVCTGEKTLVPYGSGDWLMMVIYLGMIIGMLFFMKKIFH